MKVPASIITLSLLAGCSSGEPPVDRLAPGSKAITHALEKPGRGASPTVLMFPDESSGQAKNQPVEVPAGTRVAIHHDAGYREVTDGKDVAKYYSPDKKSGSREVRVVIESGTHRGLSGTVMRSELRPVKTDPTPGDANHGASRRR